MIKMTKKYDSVFDAIADTPEEALSMKLRASLIQQCKYLPTVTCLMVEKMLNQLPKIVRKRLTVSITVGQS